MLFLGIVESTSVSSDIISLHGKLDVLTYLFNEFMLRQEKISVWLAVIMLISLVLSQNVGALRFNVFIYGTEQSKFMNIT